MEEAVRGRRRGQHADRHPPGGLAEDRHGVRIAAELRDVVLHPPQGGNLILQTVIARALAPAPSGGEARSFVNSGCARNPNGPTRYAMLTRTTPFPAKGAPS